MVTITALPSAALLTAGRYCQQLNFDFLLQNTTDQSVTVTVLEVAVFDRQHKLAVRKLINTNGFAPGIHTIPQTTVPRYGSLVLFNPFDTLDPDVEVATAQFTFTFAVGNTEDTEVASVVVNPVAYTARTNLWLPLVQRAVVYDGHDFLSHHRRLDFLHPVAQQLG